MLEPDKNLIDSIARAIQMVESKGWYTWEDCNQETKDKYINQVLLCYNMIFNNNRSKLV